MKHLIALQRKSRFTSGRTILITTLLLVSLVFAGCSGKLGKVEPSIVDTAIADAEAAIVAAENADAAVLAPDVFRSAKTNLEAAKAALTQKNGSDALRFAYQAVTDARLAHRHAMNVTKNSELNATILEKAAKAEELHRKLGTKEAELTRIASEIQSVQGARARLNQQIRDLQKENRELGDTRAAYGKQIAELSKTLDEIQARGQAAATEIRNYGKEVSALRRKLEVADRMVKEEGYQKRAAVAEAESLRRQMHEQAEIYTEKLAAASRKDVGAKHAEFLKQQAAASRAYEDSKPRLSPAKTQRTSLSTQQQTAGKAAYSKWENAWDTKNLGAHFAYYPADMVADKVVYIDSQEQRNKIDRQELEAELRQMNAAAWRKVKTQIEVESESIIGVQRFSLLVAPAADENATALYNIWIREVWMRQVGNAWKIHHEIWKIFENVPDF